MCAGLPCRWRTTDSGAKNNPLRCRTGSGSRRRTSTTRASSSLHASEHEPHSSPHERTSPAVSLLSLGAFLQKGPSRRRAKRHVVLAQGPRACTTLQCELISRISNCVYRQIHT
jgi:hypothetical protein